MSIDARLNVGLPTHSKTKKLIRRHGQAAAWNLVCMFLYARLNKADGDLSGMTDEDIEIASDWLGEQGAFVAALVDVRYLVGESGGYKVNDWEEHNPWAFGAEERSNSARLAALIRHHGKEKGSAMFHKELAPSIKPACEPQTKVCDPHADSMQPVEVRIAPLPLPSPLPNPLPNPLPESTALPDADAPDGPVARKVQLVFEYWQTTMGHPQSKLDKKRDQAIRSRLKDRYTVDQLFLAVDGCKKSPHHMGENDRATVYDDIELICRTASHVDKFIRLAGNNPALQGMGAAGRRTVGAVQQWLESEENKHAA